MLRLLCANKGIPSFESKAAKCQTNSSRFDNVYFEIEKLFRYCATNKLSINLKKTNFMLITNSNKKIRDIQIKNIEKRDFIKYLGIYIDKNLNWDYQIKHVNNKIAKNTGIINKLRYYLDLKTLKQYIIP